MHPDQSLPNDPSHQPEDSKLAKEIGQLEQRLTSMQPRAPRLDMQALHRAVEERGQSSVSPALAVNDSSIWRTGPTGVIAAAWVCGAVVGALAMFLVVGRGPAEAPLLSQQPKNEPKQPVARDVTPEIGGTVAGAVADSTASRPAASTRLRPLSFATSLLDPYATMTYHEVFEPPILRVAMYAQRSPALRPMISEPLGRTLSERPPGETNFIEQKPAPTRDQLMRDLLDQSEDPVL